MAFYYEFTGIFQFRTAPALRAETSHMYPVLLAALGFASFASLPLHLLLYSTLARSSGQRPLDRHDLTGLWPVGSCSRSL